MVTHLKVPMGSHGSPGTPWLRGMGKAGCLKALENMINPLTRLPVKALVQAREIRGEPLFGLTWVPGT